MHWKSICNECFENCKSCQVKSSNFLDQKCDHCKEGYHIMENFSSGINTSCCKEYVD